MLQYGLSKVLLLDVSGHPRAWLPLEEAIEYYAKNKVAWEVGDHSYTMRGGIQRSTGKLSELTTRSIISVQITAGAIKHHHSPPHLCKGLLMKRDCYTCAYCGGVFMRKELQQEHIIPVSKGGATTWTNIVTACGTCNNAKGARTPSQAGMPLLYLPYAPTRAEALLLTNPHILDEQRDLLMQQAKNFLRYPRPVPYEKFLMKEQQHYANGIW